MTSEEAIKEMIRAYDVLDFSCHMDNRRKEAFNMAKAALEQEPVLDKIRAEIENDWQLEKYPSSPFSCGLRRAIEIIDKYRESEDEE